MAKSKYPLSDHFDGELFFNPGVQADKSFWDVLKWKSKNSAKPWPSSVENKAQPLLPKNIPNNQVALTFINHVTFLIQFEKVNILTDPVFAERPSPLSWAGPKRVRRPGLEFEKLPKIDLVLVSHNHYDHMDLPALMRLKKKFDPVFIVPLGNKKYFAKMGDEKVIELDWWQAHSFLDLKITLTPAQHWSARTPFDRRKALWGGFFIENSFHKILFAGDTGYGQHFQQIKEKLSSPTLALLPIGAYEPRWFMKIAHMNPEDAVLAHLDLQAKTSIAMHFGTWQLTDEAIDEPVLHLQQAMQAHKIAAPDFQILEVGETKSY